MLSLDERYFTEDVANILWLCASEKHEEIVRATLDLI